MLFLTFLAVGVLAQVNYPAWLGWARLAGDAVSVGALWARARRAAKANARARTVPR